MAEKKFGVGPWPADRFRERGYSLGWGGAQMISNLPAAAPPSCWCAVPRAAYAATVAGTEASL
jgi:hypothetical protein